MTDSEKLLALALNLKAIDDAYEELAEFKLSIKARIETLLKESRALRFEVLSGQNSLPLEPAPTVMEAAEKAVAAVNAGALDWDGIKVTASVVPADTSTEERTRTRHVRRKKALAGQAAILPDKRTAFPHGHNAPGAVQP